MLSTQDAREFPTIRTLLLHYLFFLLLNFCMTRRGNSLASQLTIAFIFMSNF